MREICTEIEIEASTDIIWDIITDFDDYPNWNPFIKEISGDLKEGSHIKVILKPPNSNGMKFKPKIIRYQPENELRWLGRLWIPKLFDGEHCLIIKKLSDKKTLFIQKERFNGILVPILSNLLKDTESGFEMMNQALKQKAEGM
ncbi:MAG: SRPBCC family protein [Methanobacterium sp.]